MTRWPPLPADVAPVPGQMKGKTMTDKAEIEAVVARFDLQQPDSHMGSAYMQEEPGYGDWVRYDDYAALQAQLAAAEARAAISEPYEPGGFVGDIYYGHPVKTTFGTHRWNGEEWEKLPSEAEVLTELLAEARKQRGAAEARAEKAEGANRYMASALDWYAETPGICEPQNALDGGRRAREALSKYRGFEKEDPWCFYSVIGELGNQVHNIACELQGHEGLQERLGEIRSELWHISRHGVLRDDVKDLLSRADQFIMESVADDFFAGSKAERLIIDIRAALPDAKEEK